MIDELPTRAAMTAAAFLVLATGLSVLSAFGGDAARDAAHGLAGHLARTFNDIGALPGSVAYHGGVGADGPFELPPTVAGLSYHVEVRATAVRVIAGGVIAASPLRAAVHPFPPERASYTATELASRDRTTLVVDPSVSFVVVRAERMVDGVPTLLTFVHLP